MCTRCNLQDHSSHAKAYLTSLGGTLDCLKNSESIFDKFISRQFDEHQELTLGMNQYLYEKYPQYIKKVLGYEQTQKSETKSKGLPQEHNLDFN